MNGNPKTALVVSGGGSKGAFAVGAINYLMNKLGVKFDMVAGTSTGSLIGPFVAAGDQALLAKDYLELEIEHFVRRKNVVVSLFTAKSVLDAAPFRKVLKSRFDEARAKAVLQSSIQTIIATVSLQSGKVTYFHTGPRINVPHGAADPVKIRDRDMLLKVVEASSNQPVFMPPVKIKTSRRQSDKNAHQYVDGGVKEYAPIEVVLRNGAEHVYAILLGPETKPVKKENYKTAVSILARTFGLFGDNVGETDVAIAREVAKQTGATIKFIRPKKDLPTKSLGIDSLTQALMMNRGRLAAREAGRI